MTEPAKESIQPGVVPLLARVPVESLSFDLGVFGLPEVLPGCFRFEIWPATLLWIFPSTRQGEGKTAATTSLAGRFGVGIG
jgi:hypothetical protein